MNFRNVFVINLSLSLLFFGYSNPAIATAKPTPLPGVMAVDLYMNLEKQGWKCARPHQAKDILDPAKVDKNTTTFDCFSKDKTAYVIAWGTTASNMTWITADATTKTSYVWLGFIASLPIDGVDQASAQKWVLATTKIKKSSSKIFGDIKFSISANSGIARTLSISHKATKHP